MSLDSTIPVNPPYILQYGIPVTVFVADQALRTEVWRAPDNAGVPNDGAAVLATTLLPAPQGGVTFIDPLPNDGAIRYYKSRHVDEAGNFSSFTAYTEGLTPLLISGAGAPNPMAAFGAIVDQAPPNSKYEIRFAGNYADPDVLDGMQSYIDFPATTNFLRVGRTPVAILDSTNANPAVVHVPGHGYATGDAVVIRGHQVNTAVNGFWPSITVIDLDRFSVPVAGNGTGLQTGHVVKVSLTIDGTGIATFYGIVNAATITGTTLTVGGAATYSGTALFSGLQHSLSGVYGATSVNRVMMTNNGLQLFGDAGTGTNNLTALMGSYTVSPSGVLTNRTDSFAWSPSSATLGEPRGGSGDATNHPANKVGDTDQGDGGTATGTQSATTLQDTTKTWTVNQWQNRTVAVTGGTGAAQIRTVSSNTSNTLTISSAWTTTPDGTSTYSIAGANCVAYDGNYGLSFHVTASVGQSGSGEQECDATAYISYSLDGGRTYTELPAGYTSAAVAGGSPVTTSFSPVVNIPGVATNAMIQFKFRLHVHTLGLSGDPSGTGTLDSIGNITWTTSSSGTKSRRNLRLYDTTDGTDHMPHVLLDPLAVATPGANAVEGEVEYVGGSTHELYARDQNQWVGLLKPRYIGASSSLGRGMTIIDTKSGLSTTSTVEASLGTVSIPANTLIANGDCVRIRMRGRVVGGSFAIVAVTFGGTYVLGNAANYANNCGWWADIEIYRVGANTQKSWGVGYDNGTAPPGAGGVTYREAREAEPAKTETAAITLDFRGKTGAGTLFMDSITVWCDAK